MATGKALNGKPYAGNPHVQFDEWTDASRHSGGGLFNKNKFLLCVAVAFSYAVASIAGGEPTGCPDFEVELPRAWHSPSESRPVIRAKDFGLSEANEHNVVAINAALAEAKRVSAVRVELAPGTYKCFDGGRGTTAQPDRSNIVIDGFTDFTFDGKGATLVFRRDHAPLDHQAAQLEGEANVEVQNCRFEDCLDLRKERGVCTQIMSEIAIPPSYVGMTLPISHSELARKVAENKTVGRALTPSEDALNNILVENCTFVNPRGYLFAARNGSNMTFRGNKAEWGGVCEKLPYAGKVSISGGRDNVVTDCP